MQGGACHSGPPLGWRSITPMTSPIHIEQPALRTASKAAAAHIGRENAFGARNYDPLPVVLGLGAGAWLTDVDGKRYLDLMSAYSAVSFGHAHPRIVAALVAQAQQLAVTSRAFHNDRLPALLERLAKMTGLDRALPSNGGAEAVETALKAARKWGYRVKGIPADRAEIIVCGSNFHGRSIAIVAVPFGDATALASAITPNTAAFLVEPIQGEGGIIVPPEGYLAQCARICREHNVLLICDEIQTGLGRTGYLLACQHDRVRPDGVILGKALGGGLLPVSAFVATHDVMRVFTPGDHGSTFGGNPLAAAVAMAALDVLEDEQLCARSQQIGAWLIGELSAIASPLIREVRGRGLYIGIEIDPRRLPARRVVDRLLARGILSKDTHGTVVRIAPPLNVAQADLEWAVRELRDVLRELEQDSG
jgi:ornithine--oxo-acid transaminase